MRDAYHDQLDSILDDLVAICRQRRDRRRRGAPRPCSRATPSIAEQVISADVDDRPRPRAGRGHGVRAAVAAAAGRRRPADPRRRAADGQRARADGRPRRCTSPRSPGCGCPTSPCPTRSRPTIARMAAVAEDMVAQGRRRSSPTATSRPPIELGRDDEEMDQLRRSCFAELLVRRLDARRRGRRRHRPARPLLRADRRPRRLDRQPGRLRGHRRAPARRAEA